MSMLFADGTATVEPLAALRRAAVRAAAAASVHDTQPWRFRLANGALEIHADRSRKLEVADPRSHHLTLSCGCALLNARLSLAAEAVPVLVARQPDPYCSALMARLTPNPAGTPAGPALVALAAVAPAGLASEQALQDCEVPDPVLDALASAAESEHVVATVVRTADQLRALSTLAEVADVIDRLNPGAEAERRAWVRGARATAPGGGPAGRCGPGARPRFVVLSGQDDAVEWLRAGEALQRILLELAAHDLSAALLLHATAVPLARARLRQSLALSGEPLAVLRLGAAPVRGLRRRRLVDILDESG